jgi:hypothetical protein
MKTANKQQSKVKNKTNENKIKPPVGYEIIAKGDPRLNKLPFVPMVYFGGAGAGWKESLHEAGSFVSLYEREKYTYALPIIIEHSTPIAQSKFDELAISVDLAKVIDYYVKGFKVKGKKVLSHEWAINPVTNKVIFVLTTQNK